MRQQWIIIIINCLYMFYHEKVWCWKWSERQIGKYEEAGITMAERLKLFKFLEDWVTKRVAGETFIKGLGDAGNSIL